uniref:Uncharacterized protein n=1 Tax=Micrurus surinamensis TaxID=129470 RepID=A0A2D4PMG5_MICSU
MLLSELQQTHPKESKLQGGPLPQSIDLLGTSYWHIWGKADSRGLRVFPTQFKPQSSSPQVTRPSQGPTRLQPPSWLALVHASPTPERPSLAPTGKDTFHYLHLPPLVVTAPTGLAVAALKMLPKWPA